MSKDNISRKDFLKRLGFMGALSVGGSAIITACGGGENKEAAESGETGMESQSQAAAAQPCSDLSGLTDQEKQTRTQFQYVHETTKPDQHCQNCALFQAPEGDSPCGSCTLVKGPINPNGWCTAWSPKQQG